MILWQRVVTKTMQLRLMFGIVIVGLGLVIALTSDPIQPGSIAVGILSIVIGLAYMIFWTVKIIRQDPDFLDDVPVEPDDEDEPDDETPAPPDSPPSQRRAEHRRQDKE